jgi:8-oxo-dGTP pyrophosphatase MutT (NUDIX family)
MYKVFVDNKVIYFTDEFKKIKKGNEYVLISILESRSFPILEFRRDLSDFIDLIVVSNNPQSSLRSVFNDFDWVEAAGGLVRRKNKFLLIHRLGMWDLPKGKIDPGETREFAAIREVEEECGIKAPRLQKHLLTTYHTYEFRGKPTIKRNDWYLMDYCGPKQLLPQAEEDITEAVWLTKQEICEKLSLAYPSIQDVFQIFFKYQKGK